MAEWIISRPVSGFSITRVKADAISAGVNQTTLFKDGDTVCVIYPMPGLVIMRKDTTEE
jgi:hypothetical protein